MLYFTPPFSYSDFILDSSFYSPDRLTLQHLQTADVLVSQPEDWSVKRDLLVGQQRDVLLAV